MVLLCSPIMAMAQRNFPTRQELDSLVNPAVSKVAEDAIVADERHKNIGTTEADELVRVSFTLRNTTSEPIAITEIRSSCSCLKLTTKPQVIKARESISINASLNTEGRKGKFRHNIFVYTTLDSNHPTERLTLEGVIKNDDNWLHLPESIGDVRLSRKEVTIEGRGEERIAMANTSTKTMRLKALSTIAGLTLHTEPEVIEAGAEGNIVISYKPNKMIVSDIETMLIVEGVEASAMERTIKIKIKRER